MENNEQKEKVVDVIENGCLNHGNEYHTQALSGRANHLTNIIDEGRKLIDKINSENEKNKLKVRYTENSNVNSFLTYFNEVHSNHDMSKLNDRIYNYRHNPNKNCAQYADLTYKLFNELIKKFPKDFKDFFSLDNNTILFIGDINDVDDEVCELLMENNKKINAEEIIKQVDDIAKDNRDKHAGKMKVDEAEHLYDDFKHELRRHLIFDKLKGLNNINKYKKIDPEKFIKGDVSETHESEIEDNVDLPDNIKEASDKAVDEIFINKAKEYPKTMKKIPKEELDELNKESKVDVHKTIKQVIDNTPRVMEKPHAKANKEKTKQTMDELSKKHENLGNYIDNEKEKQTKEFLHKKDMKDVINKVPETKNKTKKTAPEHIPKPPKINDNNNESSSSSSSSSSQTKSGPDSPSSSSTNINEVSKLEERINDNENENKPPEKTVIEIKPEPPKPNIDEIADNLKSDLRSVANSCINNNITDIKTKMKQINIAINKNLPKTNDKPKITENRKAFCKEFGFKKFRNEMSDIIKDLGLRISITSNGRINFYDKNGRKIKSKEKHNTGGDAVANIDTFFVYDINEIYSIIEKFISKLIKKPFILTSEGKSNIFSIIDNEVKFLKNPKHGLESIINSKTINELVKEIDNYIDNRKQRRKISESKLSSDEKLKLLKKFHLSDVGKNKLENELMRELKRLN